MPTTIVLPACVPPSAEQVVYDMVPSEEYAVTHLLSDFEDPTDVIAEHLEPPVDNPGRFTTFGDSCAQATIIPNAGSENFVTAIESGGTEWTSGDHVVHVSGTSAGGGVGLRVHFGDLAEDSASFGTGTLPLAEEGREGLVFWATGNAHIQIQLVMPQILPVSAGGSCAPESYPPCGDYHTVQFILDDEWRQYWATWDKFRQVGWGALCSLDLDHVVGLQIVVTPDYVCEECADDCSPDVFDILMDDVGFYGGND